MTTPRLDTAALAVDILTEARGLVSQLMDQVLPELRHDEADPVRRDEWRAIEDCAALAWAQLQIAHHDITTLTTTTEDTP